MRVSESVARPYLRQVSQEPELSADEEAKLAAAWFTGADAGARERLLRANLRHVVSVAMKYRRYGVPVAELIAEGNLGLLRAFEKFEPERGLRFITYAAYWIRAYVLNHIIHQWSQVGGGSGALRSKLFFRLRRESTRASNLFQTRSEVEAYLSQKLGIARERLSEMLQQLEARDLSLDLPAYSDSATTLGDQLSSDSASPEERTADKELSQCLTRHMREALDHLDDRERYIVERRLMADPEDELSLAEIGRQLGVSRERARQLEARAKGKLHTRLANLFDSLQSGVMIKPACCPA